MRLPLPGGSRTATEERERPPGRAEPSEPRIQRAVESLRRINELLGRTALDLEMREPADEMQRMEQLRTLVLDPATAAPARVEALHAFRVLGGAPDAAIARAMVELYRSQPADEVRLRIWDELEGLSHREVLAGAVTAAIEDSSREVQEMAMARLFDFIEDPRAQAALTRIADGSPDEELREYAEDLLREAGLR